MRSRQSQGVLALLLTKLGQFATRPYVVPVRRHFSERPNDRGKAESFGSKYILPALRDRRDVILDLKGTRLITQAFFHALLAESIKEDPRRASRIRVAHATERQMAALELSLRLLLETHAERPQAVPIKPIPRTV